MFLPIEKGKFRPVAIIHRLEDILPSGTEYSIAVKDGRRFCVEAGEPQYRMGVLGLGDFEIAETDAVKRYLKAGDCAIDAGANFGWYTT